MDLIEQVAYMRGQINALEHDWKSVKDQVRKDYQRVEKANERAERRKTMEGGEDPEPAAAAEEPEELRGFAAKLRQMKGA